MWQKCYMWYWYNPMWQRNLQIWENNNNNNNNNNKGITEYDKSIVTCDVGTVQCDNRIVKYEKKIRI